VVLVVEDEVPESESKNRKKSEKEKNNARVGKL
jgi:hypothetical protein